MMEALKIKAAFLYPDIFCLNGDRGNVMALMNTAERLGLHIEVDRINLPDEKIDFAAYDIVYVPSGELKYVILVSQAIKEQCENIQEAIAGGTVFLLTGTGIALFARKIIRHDGAIYRGLGIANFDCKERTTVYGDDLVFSARVFGKEMEITGCQIAMIDTLLDKETTPLGKVLYGYGNCGKSDEGLWMQNVILTNALGPVLIKNPWLTTAMIEGVLANKNIAIELPKISWDIEESSAKKIKEFIEKKEKPTILSNVRRGK